LLPPYRRIDRLPAGTHVAALPGGGHMPMSDDPGAVAALIVEGAGRLPRVGDHC
jgi:pimeloyl-ACP methyl ester carboxylesterase